MALWVCSAWIESTYKYAKFEKVILSMEIFNDILEMSLRHWENEQMPDMRTHGVRTKVPALARKINE